MVNIAWEEFRLLFLETVCAVKRPKARIPRASSLDVFSGESCKLL